MLSRVFRFRSKTPATTRELHVGDQVLAVDGQQVAGLSSSQVADRMQQCGQQNGGQVELTLAALSAVPAPSKQQHSASCSQQPSSSQTTTTTTSTTPTPASTTTTTGKKSPTTTTTTSTTATTSTTSNPATVLIEPGKETLIEIDKGGHGLGLSIVGGSDTVLGSVVIHEVYPDGAASNDGRLKPGDQLIEVNGQSLRNVTHDQAINMLRHTPSHVRLVVYRDVNMQMSLLDPTQIYNVIEVELLKKPGKGLGLSIVGRKSEPGVYLSEVVKGGAAEADGRLMQGDQILAVNNNDVTNALQEEVATILKMSVGRVQLKVGRWKLGEDATNKNKQQQQQQQSTTQTSAENTPPATIVSPPEPETTTGATPLAKPVPTVKIESPTPSMTEPTATQKEESTTDEPEEAPSTAAAPTTTEPPAPTTSTTTTSSESPPTTTTTTKEEPKTSTATTVSSSSPKSPSAVATPGESDFKPAPAADECQLIDHLKEEGSESLLVELMKVSGQTLGMGIGRRTRGILVTSVQDGSAAAAVLKVGDRIMAVNGQIVSDQASAVEFIKNSPPKLRLQIARPTAVDENGDRPISPGPPTLARWVAMDRQPGEDYGFSIVGGATEQRPTAPVLVKRVYRYGVAKDADLRAGDQIVRVNDRSLVGLGHHDCVQLLQSLTGRIRMQLVPIDQHDQHPSPASPVVTPATAKRAS